MHVVPRCGRAGAARTDERKVRDPSGWPAKIFGERFGPQQFRQSATDEERVCLPKHDDESDVGLYRALELLRRPLRFDELAGNRRSPQGHPASVTCIGHYHSTAMSGHVMRGGRHFVEFSITNAERNMFFVHLGVIRPVSLINGIDLSADW